MTTSRTSLTLGHDPISPRVYANVHPNASISPYAGVELGEAVSISGHDPDVLRQIAGAFNQAADELAELLRDATAFGREVAAAWSTNENPDTTKEHVGQEAARQAAESGMPAWYAEHAQRVAAATFTPLVAA